MNLRLVRGDEVPTTEVGPWGIYDTKVNCWIGDDHGPNVYDDLEMARMAATIVNEQITFGRMIRIVPRVYDGKAKVKRDELTPTLSAVDAINQIESRE